jgi:hypothetical protein
MVWRLRALQHDALLAAGLQSGELHLYETKFGTLLQSLEIHKATIQCIVEGAYSIFATGSDSKIIALQGLY